MNIKVIKIGGKVIDDPDMLSKFLETFISIEGPKVLVHGGGKKAGEVSQRLGLEVIQVNGRRVTDAATLETVVMVYAGLINKKIVATLQAKGCNALGCCGADLNLIQAVKRTNSEMDFGYVGDVNQNSVALKELMDVLNKGIVPVFSAITHDGEGQLLNTNADAVASALAGAINSLQPCTLKLCFEGKGVMDGDKVLEELNQPQFEKLSSEGIIHQGMHAKLQEGFKASELGVEVSVCSYSAYEFEGGTQLR